MNHMDKFNPPIINDKPLSPVHFSLNNGVHADLGFGHDKIHVPFVGQTTLPTYGIGGVPGHNNDNNLAKLGGTFNATKLNNW